MIRCLRNGNRGPRNCCPRRRIILQYQRCFLHIARPRGHKLVLRQPLFLSSSNTKLRRLRGRFLLARAFSSNPEKDYYKILGLTDDATLAQVKAAYYKLAKKWHPELLKEKSESEQNDARAMFTEIQEAHEVLSDNKKKSEYDIQRKYGTTGQTNNSEGNQGHGNQEQEKQDFWKQQEEMKEKLEEMKRKNPEMWKQHLQIRTILNRMWKGIFFLVGLQLLLGILFRDSRNEDKQGQTSGKGMGGERAQDDREEWEHQSFNDRSGEQANTSSFQDQGLSSRDGPSFGNTSYPKTIFIHGDELPSMYLNPSSQTLDGRPTYRSSQPIAGTGMYFVLYHGEEEWRISLSQFINQASKCYARVEDSAYNPAEISGTWRVFDQKYNSYDYDSNFRLSKSPTEESPWA